MDASPKLIAGTAVYAVALQDAVTASEKVRALAVKSSCTVTCGLLDVVQASGKLDAAV